MNAFELVSSLVKSTTYGLQHPSWDAVTYPIYVAHQGMEASAPENTIIALTEAIKAGADAIETDAYLMADGNIAVIHDATTDRTCRDVNGDAVSFSVAALTAPDLESLDASYRSNSGPGFFGSDFLNNKVPTLRETLAAIAGQTCLVIGIKSTASATELETAQAVADTVFNYGVPAATMLAVDSDLLAAGFDPKGCKMLWQADTAPDLATLQTIAATGYYAVTVPKAEFDATFKANCATAGLKSQAFTYYSPGELTTVPDIVMAHDVLAIQEIFIETASDDLNRTYPGPTYGRGGGASAGTLPYMYPVIRTIGAEKVIGWEENHPEHPPASGVSRFTVVGLDVDPDDDGQYTLDFDLYFTELGETTAGVNFALFFELTNPMFIVPGTAGSDNMTGYQLGIRLNGGMQLYRMDETAGAPQPTSLTSATGLPSPPVVDTAYPVRVAVTSSGITVTFDPDGLNVSMTAADTTYRSGKYLQIERRGSGVMIGNLTRS